jgi:RNA polymerase sigma factor (sigma-70 family)
VKAVYDNYDYLRKKTENRFKESVLAEEAFTYAFEKLAEDDWRRVKAYQKKSSFRSYLTTVWMRLLEDFYNHKYGKITPPKWIQILGGPFLQLFKLLCRRRLSVKESVEELFVIQHHAFKAEYIEKVAFDILAKIPNCGHKSGRTVPFENGKTEISGDFGKNDLDGIAERMVIEKEKWMALTALTNVFFSSPAGQESNLLDSNELENLINDIRSNLHLTEEEKLILTAHFVDECSITAVGKLLGLNSNQIHSKFRRLMKRIKRRLPKLLKSYL